MSLSNAAGPVLWDTDARGVATVTLNRPEVNNAYNGELIQGLLSALDALGGANGLRAVVIKGNGDPKLVLERMWLLLRRVQQAGVREIRGDIVLDSRAFVVADGGEGDFDGDPTRPYNARPAALLLNFKAVTYTFVPEPAARIASARL